MRDIPYGYCHCGCGEKTNIAAKTNRKQGQIKGQPSRFLPGHKLPKHPDYEIQDQGYTTPCWIWLGAKDRSGYGLKSLYGNGDRVTKVAHRWIYEKLVGLVPEGLDLDHLCRVRSCVNPEHLEPVTHRENVHRGEAPSAINAQRTHCVNGHEFTPENTYLRDGKWRVCRTCRNLSVAKAYRKRAAAVATARQST